MRELATVFYLISASLSSSLDGPKWASNTRLHSHSRSIPDSVPASKKAPAPVPDSIDSQLLGTARKLFDQPPSCTVNEDSADHTKLDPSSSSASDNEFASYFESSDHDDTLRPGSIYLNQPYLLSSTFP